MMKRLAVAVGAVAVLASSAFASWDYFPPKDAGSGEAKLSFEYGIPAEKSSTMGLTVGARYSIIQGLEASLKLPVPLAKTVNDKSQDDVAGLAPPILGARYWLEFGLGFFADFVLPFDSYDDGDDDFDMEVGVQYSTSFTDELSIGAEVGVVNLVTDADIDVRLGLEVDYSLGMATPFLGVEVAQLVSDADVTFDLIVGSTFAFTDAIGAGLDLKLGLAGHGDDNLPITIGVNGSFNF